MTPTELRCLRDHQALLLHDCGCQGIGVRHFDGQPWLLLPGCLQPCPYHARRAGHQAQQTLA